MLYINFAAHSSGESILIATILLTIQSFRRLYECLFINVDSGSKMNLLHYIVGYVHYFCAGIGIFCEAPGNFPLGVLIFHVHYLNFTTNMAQMYLRVPLRIRRTLNYST